MLSLALALLVINLPTSTQDSDRLFPLPSADIVVPVKGEDIGMSMEDLVLEYGRLTQQHILFDGETRGYLMTSGVGLRRSLVIPKADVQAVFENLLETNDFVLLVLRQEQPRLLGIVSLQTGSRKTIRKRALFVPEEDLQRWSGHKAVLITTVINLPHTDVRQLSNAVRMMILDANTEQMIPAGNTNSMILTGFASDVVAKARMLEMIDDSAAAARVEPVFERLPLSHAQVLVAAPLIQELIDASALRLDLNRGSAPLPPNGHIAPRVLSDDRTNALLVLALPSDMVRIRRVVELLDVEQK